MAKITTTANNQTLIGGGPEPRNSEPSYITIGSPSPYDIAGGRLLTQITRGIASKRSSYLLPAIILSIMLSTSCAQAYTDTQIVDAIYKAEGGAKAQYAYGIRSVKYDTIEEARRICFITVKNNKKRFANQAKYTDYIEFLASRYCPVNCDNDRGTNKFWVKNVRYFLNQNTKGGK